MIRRLGNALFGFSGALIAALAATPALAKKPFCHPVSDQPQALTVEDVEAIVGRTATVANRLGQADTTIAVVDRVGNVLAVFQTGEDHPVRIRSGLVGNRALGLENFEVPSATLAAIAKAVTGAYLSSSGNAFSTRTASFIVQKNFIPTLNNFPSGPLYGVQFSQLPCGDFVQKGDAPGVGPRRSPLGLSADPGGFPLYKNGRVVGGIGVVVRGSDYSLDLDPRNSDADVEEIIAEAGSLSYAAPKCIRGERITAGGFNFRYSDATRRLPRNPGVEGFSGRYVAVGGFKADPAPIAGLAYGDAASGYMLQAAGPFASRRGMVLVDAAGNNRHAPRDSLLPATAGGGLSDVEVTTLLQQALGVANQARAQIRRPLNVPAEVTISVVDAAGNLLGMVRTPDAPVFGTDVSLQKARTAAFFSRSDAAADLVDLGMGRYVSASEAFFGANAFADGTAFTARAIGNVARPHFPDGISGKAEGPLSVPISDWSPFNVGLQLDLVVGQIVPSLFGDVNACTAMPVGIDNGIQIFPGAVPIYRDGVVIGGIGISGDGVDQDDMIAALGLERARQALAASGNSNPPGHAPRGQRSDNVAVPGPGSLRYVQCPQTPFVSSKAQNVCQF